MRGVAHARTRRPIEAEDINNLRRAWEEEIESGDAGPLDFESLRIVAEQELAAAGKG
jgi:hypothetical protein